MRLRSGSTMSGVDIATVDMIKDLIDSNNAADVNSKVSKYAGTITNITDYNNIGSSYNNNGIYGIQIANKNTNDSLPINKKDGLMFGVANELGKLQLFGTQENGGQAELYLNSGLTGNNFQKIALQKDLDTKLSLSGGTLYGNITSNSNIETTASVVAKRGYFGSLGIESEHDISITGSESAIKRIGFKRSLNGKDTSCFMYAQSDLFGFYDRQNSKEILNYNFSDGLLRSAAPQMYLANNKRVWHEGNFNPNDYIPKATVRLGTTVDMNTLTTTGFYTAYQPTNAPSRMKNWCYIEVILHGGDADRYVLQKIYDFETGISYLRVRNAGTWGAWKPLAGANSFAKQVAANEWIGDSGAYSITVTHNLGLDNITSVIFTDSNGYSMSTGFSVIDNNKLKVYCTSNVAGKIVINAQP